MRSAPCRSTSEPGSGERWRSVSLGDVDSFPVASSRLEQIGIQLVGISVCFAWAFGLGYVVLSLINRRFPFRIDEAGELAGLNVAEHGASNRARRAPHGHGRAPAHRRLRSAGSSRAPHRGGGRSRPSTTGCWPRSEPDGFRFSCCVEPLLPPLSPPRQRRHSGALEEVYRFTGWPIRPASRQPRRSRRGWSRPGSGA